MTPPPGCGSHAGLGAELRAVAVLAMDRIGPVLDRVRSEPGGSAPGPADPGATGAPTAEAPSGSARGPQSAEICAVCPVCAVIAVLRGERPELAVRLAEHAAGLLAVLQAALHEGDPTADRRGPTAGAPRPDGHGTPTRRVQHIRVDRPATARPC